MSRHGIVGESCVELLGCGRVTVIAVDDLTGLRTPLSANAMLG